MSHEVNAQVCLGKDKKWHGILGLYSWNPSEYVFHAVLFEHLLEVVSCEYCVFQGQNSMGQPIPGSGMETTRTGVCIVLACLVDSFTNISRELITQWGEIPEINPLSSKNTK